MRGGPRGHGAASARERGGGAEPGGAAVQVVRWATSPHPPVGPVSVLPQDGDARMAGVSDGMLHTVDDEVRRNSDDRDAGVADGVVTLTGTADHKFQTKEAEFVARTIMGVADVYDEVELVGPTPSVQDVEQSIRRALGTEADVAMDGIVVTASPGTVTLTGTVRSWAQRHAAVAAASDVARVRTVHDRLSISY